MKNIKEKLKFHPLKDRGHLDPLIERIGDADFVLLGEASHGTHEYYTWRTEISKRLIEEKGFAFIAVEGDWPDCFKINKWVKGEGEGEEETIKGLLAKFERWPTWMWANWEVAALAEWLKNYNHEKNSKVGFYGLDIYSMWDSLRLVMEYLDEEDPSVAKIAREAIECLEPYERDKRLSHAMKSLDGDCKEDLVKLLAEVRSKAETYDHSLEAGMNAELNTIVAKNAEKYYQSQISFGQSSWNVRDTHMVESLNTLKRYHGENAKVIIWAHNTHIGDARYTDMANDGLYNIGQLIREQQSEDNVVLVGFGSHRGNVIAGTGWGAPIQKMQVPEAVKDSWEDLLHSHSPDDKLIIFKGQNEFNDWRGHRAIGVVYNPSHERGNYVPTKLSSRYDAFLYIDETSALHSLHIDPDGDKIPETYPFGV